MSGQSLDGGQSRRSSLANGQAIAQKALGVPLVYVEAVDQDGNRVVEKVESEIALLWPYVHKEVVIGKHGKEADDPVQLPKQVGQDILALLLEYCRYHRYPGRSDKERKIFDEKFIRLDTRRLCELTSAADSLDMRPLVDLSSRALARMIEGKSPDEIRETFHLPDDLTEEEKLEPVKNVADDPRIRLLNRLYAKKRKELAEKKAELQRREAGVKCITHPSTETRTVEELLSFIEEEERQGQSKKQGKRKKPRKKKDSSGDSTLGAADSSERNLLDKDISLTPSPGITSPRSLNRGESLSQDGVAWPEVDGLNDADLDDEIEAFERSLRADWEDRRAELILMAGAFQSKPSRGGYTGDPNSMNPLPTAAAPHENGQRNLHPQNSQKAGPPGVQQQLADETAKSVSSLPASASSGVIAYLHQTLGTGHASMPQPKHTSPPESSSNHFQGANGKDHPTAEEGATDGPGASLNGRSFSHDRKRLLRDTPTSDSATCSASKSPSATPDRRHQATNGSGHSSGPSSGMSRAQSGISNLRLPDGNVLEEGPFDAQLHAGSTSSESSASGDSPPPQPSTPRHGSNDLPVAAIHADSEYGVRHQLKQLGTETYKGALQPVKLPDGALQDRTESDLDKAASKAGPSSPLEDRGQPSEIDQTPKAEAIVDLFQSFLDCIGFDKNAISLQVNSHPQWHGLPQVHAPAVVERHVPGLGVLSFQHRSAPS